MKESNLKIVVIVGCFLLILFIFYFVFKFLSKIILNICKLLIFLIGILILPLIITFFFVNYFPDLLSSPKLSSVFTVIDSLKNLDYKTTLLKVLNYISSKIIKMIQYIGKGEE